MVLLNDWVMTEESPDLGCSVEFLLDWRNCLRMSIFFPGQFSMLECVLMVLSGAWCSVSFLLVRSMVRSRMTVCVFRSRLVMDEWVG